MYSKKIADEEHVCSAGETGAIDKCYQCTGLPTHGPAVEWSGCTIGGCLMTARELKGAT